MLIAAALFAATAMLWMGVAARRASLLGMCLLLVGVGYVLGHDAWHFKSLTLDRLLLLGIVGVVATRIWRGQIRLTSPTGADWAIGVVLAWLSLSCITHWPDNLLEGQSAPLFRLVVSFWVPAFIYLLLRHERFDSGKVDLLLKAIAGLGVYLAITALLETLGLWSLVFPRYIADPELGLHFGRARGPGLNSVSLGVYLGVAAVATWLLIPRSSRWMQLFWGAAFALMCLGVLMTYTRSTWIGLALAGLMIVTLQLPRRVRWPMFGVAVVAGGALLITAKGALVSLEREDSANVSAHSVQQRVAFAYVSYKMIVDHPLQGVGFGRFVDKKLPYLTDRSQKFELESLRELEHHNTFLSLLTETGMMGLGAYLAVLLSMGAAGWRLAHDGQEKSELRPLGLLAIGALCVYVPSAIFHDLTLVHSDQWLLFLAGGSAVGAMMNRGELPQVNPVEQTSTNPSLPWATAT